jgi:hypothetical protein
MSLDHLEKILKELQQVEDIEYVMFSAMGEPLLHPQFLRACELVKQYGFKLYVTTNGSLLSQAQRTAPIDRLYISFQTPSERSFEHRHAPALTYQEYLKKIKSFTDGDHPPIMLYVMGTGLHPIRAFNKGFMDFPLHYPDREKTYDILNAIGIYFEPEFKGITNSAHDFYTDRYIPLRDKLYLCCSELGNWCNLFLPDGFQCSEARTIMPRSCDFFVNQIVILANGDVTFCCMDYNGDMAQGNIMEEKLADIVKRKEKLDDLGQFALCRTCRGNVVRTVQTASQEAQAKR